MQQQSGAIAIVKANQYFEKPLSKRERRLKAIVRTERRALKVKTTKPASAKMLEDRLNADIKAALWR